MFAIIEKAFGDYQSVKIQNNETLEYITVIPNFGLCLNELVLNSKNGPVNILLNNNNPEDFAKTKIPMFSGVKLFPFPNRVKDAVYNFIGRDYQLPKNDPPRNHALHGLVFDKIFSLKSFDGKTGMAEFEYIYDGSFVYYPFPYILTISIKLTATGAEITSKVKNTGNAAMPLGDGWHPYISTGTPVDKMLLQIPGTRYFESDSALIPTLNKIEDHRFEKLSPIGSFEMDNCYIIEPTGGKVSTVLYDPEKDIKIDFWQQTGTDAYNYVQFYTPENRQSIAVEPMSSAPDAIHNNIGLIILPPAQEKTFVFGIGLLNN
ncbi:MAG: aldose 1-epimerase [Bacteroidales bacterium]|nr:aldose 1-epimerase [Bacteroidales bacterium]